MVSTCYDPLTHAYMLLCGAVHLIEEYDTEVFLQLRNLPNRSAYHITWRNRLLRRFGAMVGMGTSLHAMRCFVHSIRQRHAGILPGPRVRAGEKETRCGHAAGRWG